MTQGSCFDPVALVPRLRLSRLGALAIALGTLAAGVPAAHADPVDWVDVLSGTGSGPTGYGRTMPYVTPPFGMTSWTPQTRQNFQGGVSYKYEDKAISGFMGTHQAALWMGDYGYVTLMPEIGTLKTAPADRKLAYRHADQVAEPDYYSVWMDADKGQRIRTEITAAAHSAYLRFTFPAGDSSTVLLEASRAGHKGFVHVDPAAREITGYNPERVDANLGPLALPNFKGYFVVQFRKAFDSSGTYGDDQTQKQALGAYARFTTAEGEVVEARVGTSFISLDQARASLAAEIPDWDFDKTRQATRAAWNRKLGGIDIDGASDEQRHIFYTAFYHAMLYPRDVSEQGRYYSAFDDQVHTGVAYTDYSIWDIFRAEYDLLTLTAPERAGPMVQALLNDYREGGWMPKWPNPSYTNIMIATHADSLVAEAVAKHLKGFDRDLAWDAVYKDAMTPPDGDVTRRWHDRDEHTPYEARAGLTYLKALGYIPVDKTAEAASSTLEDSYDDWAVAQVAKGLGKTKDYDFFLKRSLNYRNLYNPATGFMQGRNFDGGWADSKAGWTEGDKWTYSWAVMQDIPGLIRLMGGDDAYNNKLDAYFDGDHNWHSNEPSHHYGYLYDYSGQPWKTQAKVREIATWEYAAGPSGLDGDDDCGQMSAWYMFTAMGFYPVNPASGDYMIGSPLYGKAVIHLADGKRFTVVAENNSDKNLYIQSATLNGKPLNAPMIRYADIMAGSTLKLKMGPKPSRWAASWRGQPIMAEPLIAAKLPPSPSPAAPKALDLAALRPAPAAAASTVAAPADFSGTWKLNAARSDYGDGPGPWAQTDVIAQSGGRIRLSIASTMREKTQTYVLDLPVGGGEIMLPQVSPPHLGPANLTRASAVWRGDQLVVSQRVEFQDEAFTFPSMYSLSSDGRTLTVTAHLGRNTNTMVFEKVAAAAQ
ncbi:MAG: GH92 family glycosyl hydrolase [Caulobacteraceae bacterium]